MCFSINHPSEYKGSAVYQDEETTRKWYSKLSLESAINAACLGKQNGSKRHPHFHSKWKLNNMAARSHKATKALNRRIADIRATKIFDNLLDLIKQELMAGPDPAWENARNSVLTYDIADWIGCSLDVVPEHVYLHDACKRGVEMALSRKLPSSQRYVCIGELPEEWRGLKPYQLETAFCAYVSGKPKGWKL